MKENLRISRISRQLVAVIVVIVAVSGFLVGAYAFHLFGGGQNCWVRPTTSLGTAVYTIVMANEGFNVGYNGSKYHTSPWPVINVTVGQSVLIHVINNDSQAHGFQIPSYFDQGIGGNSGLAPGQCYNVSFIANQIGQFPMRCDIFCTIHAYMLSGILNVNP